jgi:signal transduction histidine kinase
VSGFEQVVAFLEDLRDRQAKMRRRSDAPPWFHEEFGRLAPSLSGALSTARSLLSFSRGELQKEPIEIEELVAELKAEGVSTEIGPGTAAVSGDRTLLRLALRALVDQLRLGRGPVGDGPALEIRASAVAGQVRISVADKEGGALHGFPLEVPAPTARPSEESLALVRRIAELHGGNLRLEGGGEVAARFTLTLLRA